ncbi:signal transduction histidine kinase/ActR/RegA family two-component response regulator [Paraburkholderia sp. HC6.4b]|uniref:ATP-binding response regulator n=1 Tax=unclassified Paraburkholderia TaxID=2615204 RepID=UPI00161B8E83|nr:MULTISPECIES: hybrid sensor histidine kinase/response regulator [unclassified Paraburkholderia]MBB5412989.1 signal transduction histidine kinase/ActR/RegA family two-component response regulator [Paraburkholderia sp. HC6.4b]MBB5455272.1 signal transduction histidine kinase/ActR/RegA family two-component response regulator [Paraburkholderia sp. Kb1A]
MRADPIQRAIDEDLVRVLYAQDPIAFFSHWFSIAVLVAIYWPHVPAPPLFIACFVFYALANCAGLALWICNRRYPQLVSPRDWIYLHALRGVLLYSGPGFAVWFAFQSPQTDLPLLHTVLLVTLAAGVFMSNGFDLLNFSTSIPFLLLPSIVLHFGSHTFDRTILAIVLAFFFCAINVYAMSYRKLFRQVVQARVDQQYLAESLAAQKRVAEEASLAKTRFFAAASHDLRQPLHAIGLLAASLNDPAATPAQHAKTAGHIVYNVEALNQLFNQVLDLARLESGVTQVIRLHFRLSELFERVGSQYRPQAAAKGLALRIAPTTMVVYDDPVLLERVVSNLLSNAVRYTEQGAIWLGFRRAGRQKGGYIEVRDSGVGMAPQEHERIFEEFYQVENPQRDARQGHGLGLPTVRRLVGLLGGELQLRSAPGRGSVFRFAVQAGDASGIVASLNDSVAGGPAAQGRRVLCIDDEPSILEGLASLLERWGCDVRGARDEAGALAALADGFVPDAVLCDYQLANHRTGAQALSAIRGVLAREGHGNVVTLLITGDMASAELTALALQGIPVLHKPVTPARLRRTLEMLWQQAELDQGRPAGAVVLGGGAPDDPPPSPAAAGSPQAEAGSGAQSETQP